MAHRHPSGQVSVEVIVLISFLTAVIMMALAHLTIADKVFEKIDLTQGVKNEHSVFGRKK